MNRLLVVTNRWKTPLFRK